MQILLWLVPAAVATCAAMALAGWLGREPTTSERAQRRAQVRAQERLTRAMEKPMTATTRVRPPRVRSTGIAVRSASRPAAGAVPQRRVGGV